MTSSNRLILKPLSADSISTQYLSWMNDPEILKFTESRFTNHDKTNIKRYIENMNNSPTDYLFGIYVIKTNKHIGNIKIGNINTYHKFADLGIIIGAKDEWGKGYATEAITLAIDYAFRDLSLYKLTAGVYANNIASVKALKKAGFKECGRYTNHCIIDENRRVDVIMFEIINRRSNR